MRYFAKQTNKTEQKYKQTTYPRIMFSDISEKASSEFTLFNLNLNKIS